jgi:hypothetical protein
VAILRGELKMEESGMQVCSICGITRGEQEFQQHELSEEYRKLRERWEQHHDPNEPPPGLPNTHEYRVHYALWLYENDSSMDATVVAIARAAQKARVDYNSVIRALHANKTNESVPGLPLTDEDRVRYALIFLDLNDSSKIPDDAAIALVARKVGVDPDLVVKELHHANRRT